jgi:hypothetical protein
MRLIRLVRCGVTLAAGARCYTASMCAGNDPELHSLCRIPPFAVVERRVPVAGSMFFFEQTAAFSPDLFRALPNWNIFPISPALVAGLFARTPSAADQAAA